jgi:hypothetical protein
MRIIDENEKSKLIVTEEDNIGRADARLVSLVSKISRATKRQIESFYHSEDVYETDKVVLIFNTVDKDKILKLVMLSGFVVK